MKRMTRDLCRKTAQDFNRAGVLPPAFEAKSCTQDDLDDILTLGRACFAYNPPTRAELKHALTEAHAVIYGLYEKAGGILAGYVFVEGHMGRKNLYINTAVVDARYRGQGLGGALYDLAERTAHDIDAANLWCHTAENNEANIGMMKKKQYKKERREDAYYEDGRAALIFRKRMA